MSTLATKNFDLSRMYGASASAAPCGMLYFSRRSQVSSPDESVADRMTIWYSPLTNWASILTPRSSAPSAALPFFIIGLPPPIAPNRYSRLGAQGSCSQYSTRRGADSESTRSNTSAGSVLTSSLCSTTGTGTTMAKFSGGP